MNQRHSHVTGKIDFYCMSLFTRELVFFGWDLARHLISSRKCNCFQRPLLLRHLGFSNKARAGNNDTVIKWNNSTVEKRRGGRGGGLAEIGPLTTRPYKCQ